MLYLKGNMRESLIVSILVGI